MKTMTNRTHIEGLIYEHDLQLKVSGENSKNPGTPYITGTISLATDNNLTNIVSVHYSYVTEKTSTGKTNSSFGTLNKIIDGDLGSVMEHGKENAAKLRIDSAIGLNEFYTDRNGEQTLVSAKRNEGGFMHVVNDLNADENTRNTFEVDMIITGTRRQEADEERGLPEKVILKGAIFDFRKALLPVELSVLNPIAMDYFEGLEPTSKEPVFTKVKGRQVSEVIVRKIVEESAFGEDSVREVTNTRKDFVVTWAMKEPYAWDDEGSILVTELQEAMANRETYLATLKQRADEYKASSGKPAPAAAAPKVGGFNF